MIYTLTTDTASHYYHFTTTCPFTSPSPYLYYNHRGTLRPLAVSGLLATIDDSYHQGAHSDSNDSDNGGSESNGSDNQGVVSLVKFDCDGGYAYYRACSTGQTINQPTSQPISQPIIHSISLLTHTSLFYTAYTHTLSLSLFILTDVPSQFCHPH